MLRGLALLLCLLWSSQALSDTSPRLTKVTPSQKGQMVVCRLQSAGLPGAKQLQSMRSGLESALEIRLSLLDKNENVVGLQIVSLRLAFDLWEEIFSVKGSGRDQQFKTLDGLQNYLSDLRDVPVSPLGQLGNQGLYRIKAQIVPHAIALAEQQRVEDAIVGETRPRREGLDQQEASVSLGRLIRLFYKGSARKTDGLNQFSNWFQTKELLLESH